jgi:hypothetical protein
MKQLFLYPEDFKDWQTWHQFLENCGAAEKDGEGQVEIITIEAAAITKTQHTGRDLEDIEVAVDD